jgi:hypothetical protein
LQALGSWVTVTASADPGYTVGTVTATDGAGISGAYPTYTLSNVTAPTTVSATFTPNSNAITYSAPTAAGSITGPATVLTGATADLTATTSAGYTLNTLTATNGTIGGAYPNFTLSGVTEATTVTITFTANDNPISYVATPPAGGEAAGPATVLTGATGTVNVTTNPGYTFSGVTVNAGASLLGAYPTYGLTNVTAATTVTATFTANTNAIAYSNPPVGGSISGPATVLTGDTAPLTATTAPGYTVDTVSATNGTVVAGTYPNFTLSGVTADTTVSITFTANANAITIVKDPAAGGDLTGPTTVLTDGSVNLAATTNAGFTLGTVTATNGIIGGAFPTYTLSGVTAATTVTITWTANTNAITYTATPLAAGTVTGPATVLSGGTAPVLVTTSTGYSLLSVNATNGTIGGTYPNFTLSGVTADTAVTATFTLSPTWNLAYVASPSAGGTVSGPPTILQSGGPTATVIVTANPGYALLGVTANNGATLTGAGPYTLSNVMADTTVTATFGVVLSAVSLTPTSATANIGDPFTFTATATGGVGTVHYEWTKDGNPAPFATDNRLYTIAHVALSDAGVYRVDSWDASKGPVISSNTVTLVVTAVNLPVAGLFGLGLLGCALLGGGAFVVRRRK